MITLPAETLETLGRVQFRDSLHGMVTTAHLSRLPGGDLVGLCADFAPVLDGATGLLVRQEHAAPCCLLVTAERCLGGLALSSTPHPSAAPLAPQRLPELTVFRQSPWQSDRRQRVASVPYARPTAPTWVHEASGAGEGKEGRGRRGGDAEAACAWKSSCTGCAPSVIRAVAAPALPQFPVSERYAVVVQCPVFYNIRSMLLGQVRQRARCVPCRQARSQVPLPRSRTRHLPSPFLPLNPHILLLFRPPPLSTSDGRLHGV